MDSYRKNYEPLPDVGALVNVQMANGSETLDYAQRTEHVEKSQAYLTARSKRMAARIAKSDSAE